MKKLLITISLFVNFMSFETQAVRTRFGASQSYGFLNIRGAHETDIEASTYATISLVVLGIKIAYDWSWHGDYGSQSEHVFKRFVNHIRLNNINSLKDPLLYTFFKSIDRDFCLTYESWLRDSYDSWLKPWNWTAAQKAAYEKMEILSMILLHGSLIVLDQQEVEKELVKHARKHCSAISEYPLVYYANQIDAHLAALKKGFSVRSESVQKMLLELEQELYQLKYILRGNKSYIEECHTLKTHRLLEKTAQNR